MKNTIIALIALTALACSKNRAKPLDAEDISSLEDIQFAYLAADEYNDSIHYYFDHHDTLGEDIHRCDSIYHLYTDSFQMAHDHYGHQNDCDDHHHDGHGMHMDTMHEGGNCCGGDAHDCHSSSDHDSMDALEADHLQLEGLLGL